MNWCFTSDPNLFETDSPRNFLLMNFATSEVIIILYCVSKRGYNAELIDFREGNSSL